MVVTLILLIANAVAVQCIGYDCMRIDYFQAVQLAKVGSLELIFEIMGFIRIYRKKE